MLIGHEALSLSLSRITAVVSRDGEIMRPSALVLLRHGTLSLSPSYSRNSLSCGRDYARELSRTLPADFQQDTSRTNKNQEGSALYLVGLKKPIPTWRRGRAGK